MKGGQKTAVRAKKRAILPKIICALLVVVSLSVLFVGLWIGSSFDRTLPEEFFRMSAKGEASHFFVYDFEDRTARVGEAREIDTGLFAANESAYIAYPDIPKSIINAFVAIEDKRFYSHRGVDWFRTAAASVNYLLGFSSQFGASTITQQVVKNVTGDSEISPRRKLQEILYARDLERKLDKSEILELYLNVIHFSDRCDGIAAASAHYFSKTPQELTVAEAATIAAITNSPSYYNPIRHPENNLARRNLILREMREQGYLSEDEYQAAVAEPIKLNVSQNGDVEGINSWYVDMVIEDVITDLMARYNLSRGTASRLVYSGGLRIDMAIDEDVQKIVEDYYKSAVKLPQNANGTSAQSALIVIDSRTGDVLGVAGAVGEKQGNRLQNFATQTLRPPGSAIKPLTVYAPALEKGLIDWASVYDDVPIEFDTNGRSMWPKNATNTYRGLTNVAYAVAHSTNTVAVRILEEVGMESAFDYAKNRFHLTSLRQDATANDCDRAALALGQLNYGVTLREITAAYSVFADRGVYHPYRSYYRVLDRDGKILLSNPDRSEIVMSEGNAAIMTKLLEGVVRDGTSSAITLTELTECAGKTGTTNADGDRWFIGYTPDLICGVWCGYEYPEPLVGRNLCTDIWNRVMRSLVKEKGGRTKFEIPSSVVRVSYCRDSGKLTDDACTHDPRGDRTELGWFFADRVPTAHCDCHILCPYDTEHGGVCHETGEGDWIGRISLIRVERHFPKQVYVTDAQYVYRGDPASLAVNPDPTKAYFDLNLTDFCGISHVEKPFNRSAEVRTPPPNDDWKYLIPNFQPPDNA